MLYTKPDYYKIFTCTADQCEDTCCAGWQIVVDKESLKKYGRVRGSYLGTMLKRINWLNHTFRQDGQKRCAFLNEDNLCDMYIHLGSNSLCQTCRMYPRHVEEFEGVREETLSVSCPEVARILMNRMTPVVYESVEDDHEEMFDDFDPFLYSMLLDAREAMMDILQNRSLPLDVRAGLIYGVGRGIQKNLDAQQIFVCQDVIEKYKTKSAVRYIQRQIQKNSADIEKLYAFYKEMFARLYKLELLKEDWYVQLKETEYRIFESDASQYKTMTAEFDQWINKEKFPWDIQKEQLLVYFIYTYFCGAVYDGQVLDKVQMAVISVNLLEEMIKSRWLRNEKMLDIDDVIELVYRYSREVEHSDINLKRMEKMMPWVHGLYC